MNILKEVIQWGNLGLLNQEPQKIVNSVKKLGIHRGSFLKILELIEKGKQEDARNLFASNVFSILHKRKLSLPEPLFLKYIRPAVSIVVSYVIQNLSYSRESIDRLKSSFKR